MVAHAKNKIVQHGTKADNILLSERTPQETFWNYYGSTRQEHYILNVGSICQEQNHAV